MSQSIGTKVVTGKRQRLFYILSNFYNDISPVFPHHKPTIMIYGSTILKTGSDLDLCVIVPEYEADQCERVANAAINLHSLFNLKLDWDVPYTKKTIYSFSEINRALTGKAFSVKNNYLHIEPIIKDKDYLASDTIKDRLILNILTTKSIIFSGNRKKISAYRKQAWYTLIRLVFSHTQNKPLSKDEFINYLGSDPLTNKKYKDYLGYNLDNRIIKSHLSRKFESVLKKLIIDGIIIDKKGKLYCSDEWVNELINQRYKL